MLENYYFSLSSTRDGELTKELADYLFYFEQYYIHNSKQRCDSLITLFQPIAGKYRELEVKPIVSEEQRKYIVQANSFNEQKAYNIAIDLYMKATEIDQTSYPAAYYNLALLSINVNQFYGAIFYMKKYLMLVPDAEDARAAQDKIYEWETIIEKGKYN
jgi:tetratricopeptide (TPR) repeat protein